jgi:SmpA / OmlA family
MPLLAVATAIFIGTIFAGRTFINHGPAAVAMMDPEELAILAKTEQLQRGMSKQQVVAILGDPDEEGTLGMRRKWCLGNCMLNGLAVYILPDGAQKVLWIGLGRFVYQRIL